MSKPNKQKKIDYFVKKIARNKIILSGEGCERLKSKRLKKKYSDMLWFSIPVAILPVVEDVW